MQTASAARHCRARAERQVRRSSDAVDLGGHVNRLGALGFGVGARVVDANDDRDPVSSEIAWLRASRGRRVLGSVTGLADSSSSRRAVARTAAPAWLPDPATTKCARRPGSPSISPGSIPLFRRRRCHRAAEEQPVSLTWWCSGTCAYWLGQISTNVRLRLRAARPPVPDLIDQGQVADV